MHHETYVVPASVADVVAESRAAGGRVWAVGTTVVRTLEAAAELDGRVRPGAGSTDLFIRPPYDFRVVDALITNFHLPRSTLLMLVAAFGGYARVMAAYEAAVRQGYRFYPCGDAGAGAGCPIGVWAPIGDLLGLELVSTRRHVRRDPRPSSRTFRDVR